MDAICNLLRPLELQRDVSHVYEGKSLMYRYSKHRYLDKISIVKNVWKSQHSKPGYNKLIDKEVAYTVTPLTNRINSLLKGKR